MALKIAINGFGRIGRLALRSIVENGRKGIDVVAINDLGPVDTNAHLVQYDSVHGKFPNTVKTTSDTIRWSGMSPMPTFTISSICIDATTRCSRNPTNVSAIRMPTLMTGWSM